MPQLLTGRAGGESRIDTWCGEADVNLSDPARDDDADGVVYKTVFLKGPQRQ